MNHEIKIFETPELLAEQQAKDFKFLSGKYISGSGSFNVALSGGDTPKLFFEKLSQNYSDQTNWMRTKFFWCDERCVSPYDKESNYGMTQNELLKNIRIPGLNIYRIYGEDDPVEEAGRYSSVLKENLPLRNGIPKLDLIFLGMGEDGHTASIFPYNINLINSPKICEVSVHPATKQKRVTLTGRVLNNADLVFITVAGYGKAEKLKEVVEKNKSKINNPIELINPEFGKLFWYLDKEAAKLL